MAFNNLSHCTPLDEVSEPTSSGAINLLRLLLAGFMSLPYFSMAQLLPKETLPELAALSGYLGFSLLVLFAPRRYRHIITNRFISLVDVAWYGLIVAITGPLTTIVFPVFLFAIMVSSMRHGAKEGRKITLASVVVYIVSVMVQGVSYAANDWEHLTLRVSFLLSLGLMIAGWGGREVILKRRLTLLKDVSLVSNPRFGIDHTVASVMEKMNGFFEADQCMMVYRNADNGVYFMRQTAIGNPREAIYARPLSVKLAFLLLPSDTNKKVVLYDNCSVRRWHYRFRCRIYSLASKKWNVSNDESSQQIGDILNAASFISAPLHLRKNAGRIYLLSNKKAFTTEEAVFLAQSTAHAFSVIANVDLVDQLASEAAEQERRRLIGNLHDSTIQPYIGLKLGLEALRVKVEPHSTIMPVIDQLLKMANDVIDDLRSYVSELKEKEVTQENALVSAVRRQATKFNEFYGISINVLCNHQIHVNDRLAAEVLQIVKEGLSNIRKHTLAQSGAVEISCSNHFLSLKIQNEELVGNDTSFIPRSITERAQALGGKAWVERNPNGSTIVAIEIPI